jgi:hypothetical protein
MAKEKGVADVLQSAGVDRICVSVMDCWENVSNAYLAAMELRGRLPKKLYK